MAKFCTNCGSPLSESMKFCVSCGAQVQAVRVQSPLPAPTVPPVQTGVPQTRTQRPQPQGPQAGQTGKPQPPRPRPSKLQKKPRQSPEKNLSSGAGAALCGAFLCIGCLPYLLKSLLFLATEDSLGTAVCAVLDLLGVAAALVILFARGKALTGRSSLSAAVLLAALLPGVETASLLLSTFITFLNPWSNLLYVGCTLLLRGLAASLALWALSALFVTAGRQKKGGRFLAWLCAFGALFAQELVMAAWQLSPLSDVISFFATFACKALIAFVEVCALTGAAALLLRPRKGAPAKERRVGFLPLAAGMALVTLTVVVSLIGGAMTSVTEIALEDVGTCIVRADTYTALGDMDGALDCYELAAAHCEAWQAAARGETCTVPNEFRGDTTLEYLSYLCGPTEALTKYLATDLDVENLDLWCPLMIGKYREKAETEELSQQEQAHLTEMLRLCVSQECFVFDHITPEDVREEKDALLKAVEFPEAYRTQMELIQVIARLQQKKVNVSDSIRDLLEVAEKYPEEMVFQYIAAYVGSENRWDGAWHYSRTADAIERYRELWLDKFGKEATRQELTELDSAMAGMLLNMGVYDRAIPLLENALAEDSGNLALMQQLAYCYTATHKTEEGYSLSKDLYAASPNDPTVIWSYAVGALKHGEAKEAIEAAGRMADLVRTELGSNQDGRDEMLFNLVLYLALNDSASWTDYQYRVYNGESTDPELLAAFQQNEFLYNYVQAVYWEKQCRDPAAAVPFGKTALEAQEGSGRLWYLNAIIFFDNGDFEEALRCYQQADTLEPDDPSILFGLANTYDALEDYQTAYNYCVRALSHYPAGVDHSYDNYGVSYHARALLNRLQPYVEVDEP